MGTGASVQEVLETAFGQMNTIVKQNDLVNKYKAQGLTCLRHYVGNHN